MDVSGVAFVVSASIGIAAPAGDTYDALSDITRMGEWSPECVSCEWIRRERAWAPVGVGDRFRGLNRSGSHEWTTECEVIVAQRPREFAWEVLSLAPAPRTSVWRFVLTDTAFGVSLEERFEMSAPPHGLRRALERMVPERGEAWLLGRQHELLEGIRTTLSALKSSLEGRDPTNP